MSTGASSSPEYEIEDGPNVVRQQRLGGSTILELASGPPSGEEMIRQAAALFLEESAFAWLWDEPDLYEDEPR